jgi:hypothetical protein
MIVDQLPDFTLNCSGFLEYCRMGTAIGVRGKNPKRWFTKSLRNGVGVCEEDINGSGGKKNFRVWPNSPIYSGRDNLDTHSTKCPAFKYKNALKVHVNSTNCSWNSWFCCMYRSKIYWVHSSAEWLSAHLLGHMIQKKQITHQLHMARTRWLLKHFSTRGTTTYGLGSK